MAAMTAKGSTKGNAPCVAAAEMRDRPEMKTFPPGSAAIPAQAGIQPKGSAVACRPIPACAGALPNSASGRVGGMNEVSHTTDRPLVLGRALRKSFALTRPLPEGERLSFAVRAPAVGGWVRGTILRQTQASRRLTPPHPVAALRRPPSPSRGEGAPCRLRIFRSSKGAGTAGLPVMQGRPFRGSGMACAGYSMRDDALDVY